MGCAGDDGPSPMPMQLAAGAEWERETDAAKDPFAAMRPADAVCDPSGFGVDPLTLSFEVRTDVCDYLTVRQGSRAALGVGDVITVEAAHGQLAAAAPATGYMALALDGEVVWEWTAAIPGEVDEVKEEFVVQRALPAGAEMHLHVHNHGANSWELVGLTVTPAR